MIRTDGIGIAGRLTVLVRDARSGRFVARIVSRNLVVLAGRNLIRDRLQAGAVAALTHFAVGTSNAAVTSGDTALQAEVFRDTITQFVNGSGILTVKYYLATGSANGNTLAEAGLLNASSGGTLFSRVVLASTIVKTTSITVTFQWDFTITAS